MRVNSINNTYKSSFKGLLQFSNNMVINPSQITHIETKSSKVEDFDRFDLPKKLKFNEVITVFEDGKFVERQPALSEYFEHGYDLRLKEEGMISLANGDKYYFSSQKEVKEEKGFPIEDIFAMQKTLNICLLL